MDDAPYVVVGLGNPEPAYETHRHNAGFLVADLLAERMGTGFRRHRRAHALTAEGRLGGPGGIRVVLAKPLSYMNLSGGPVAGLVNFYKVPAEKLVVVHDELDLPFGVLRLKLGGGEGGHNGVRSVARALGTPDFARVRFGIGRPPGRKDPADFVLEGFSATERKDLPVLVERAADAVEAVLERGVAWAQNTFHAD